MKNKKINIALLILALGIWGYIIYSVFSGKRGSEIAQTPPENEIRSLSKNEQDTIQFNIIADYPDPFLKGSFEEFKRNYNQIQAKKHYNLSQKIQKRKIPDRTIWPKISYHGLFSDSEGLNKIGYFYIDNHDVMLREGESYKEIRPVKIFRDSVVVKYKKSTKVIYR